MRPVYLFLVWGVCGLLCQLTSAAAASSKQRIVIHESTTPHQQNSQPPRHQAGFDHYRNFRSGASTTTPTTNSKACPARSVLRVDFSPAPEGDGRIYGNIFGSGVLLASAQDVFEYEIMWKDQKCNCGAEFEVGTQYRHRDDGPLDALGYSPHSERNANMSAVAYGVWYKRRWSLAAVEGKYIDKFVLSAFSSPGVTVTAFFKYIRIVRGEEKRRVVFDSGSEPPNVTPYFPGTILNSCQHEMTLDGSQLTVVSGNRASPQDNADGEIHARYGDSITLRGMVTARSLSDMGRAREEEGVRGGKSLWFAPVWEEFRWLSFNLDDRARIASMDVLCRLGAPYANIVLMDIARWRETKFAALRLPNATTAIDAGAQELIPQLSAPWSLDVAFTVPPKSPLTHLLNGSWIDVGFEYHLVLDGWASPLIRTVVKSYRLFVN